MSLQIPFDKILSTLCGSGCDYADVFYENTQSTTIIAEDKKIDTLTQGRDCGVGLRLISNLKTDYACTNDLTTDALEKIATDLSQASSSNVNEITLNQIKSQHQFPIAQDPSQIEMAEKIKLIQDIEKQAWNAGDSIVQVNVRYNENNRYSEIANSLGHHAINPKQLMLLSVTITVSDGQQYTTGYDVVGGHQGYEIFDGLDTDKLVAKAYQRACFNLTAPRIEGGTMPVVISSEAGGTLVHEAVGHGLEADLVCEDLSVFKGKQGQKIAADCVTIIDDSTLAGRRGSYAFDDEGIPSEKVTLIENGELKTFLFDQLSSFKMNQTSNGHGRRENYAYRPIVRMANTLMAPGQDDPEAIIASVNQGLFVKMMGGGEVNTVNGDFVFEVNEAHRIENGAIGEPVKGVTLTGNCLEVLQTIDKVGNDLGFSMGTCGKDGQGVPICDAMPTVRIPELVVGSASG